MSATAITLLCTLVVSIATVVGLYYTARMFSVSAREKALAEAKRPLERQISELQGAMARVERDNDYLRRRVDELTDELRQHR